MGSWVPKSGPLRIHPKIPTTRKMGSPRQNNAKFPYLLFSQAPNRPDRTGYKEMTRINQTDVER